MLLAKVIGNVVSTQKNVDFRGMKLLLLQPYIAKDGELVPSGRSIIAVDSVGAGEDELVMFTRGSSARLTESTRNCPVDAVIVGIIDSVEVGRRLLKKP